MTRDAIGRRRRRRRLLLFVLFSFGMALAAGEALCRARETLRERRASVYYPAASDAYRTIVLEPGVHRVEGPVACINSLGMRGPEVPAAKADGVLQDER